MKNNPESNINPALRQRARELRKEQTPAESHLWSALRGRVLGGYKFRRQHPIGTLIVDFYCQEVRLVIEVDGPVHNRQKEYDAIRTTWLEEHGYCVIRFTNEEVLNNLEQVLERILTVIQENIK